LENKNNETQIKETPFKKPSDTKSFEFERGKTGYRYLRVLQKGKSSNGTGWMAIGGFEVYGNLIHVKGE